MGHRRVRFALVGGGAVAQSYLRAFELSARAELVAVADIRKETADAVAESARCAGFASCEEMCERIPFEAAVICTPPSSHRAIAEGLVERGVHVLCEKPLALNSSDARAMFEAAGRSGRLLTMASKFRHVPDIAQARSIVTSGVIGEVSLMENTFTARVDMSNRWNSRPEVSGGGVLIDNGTHSVDIMRFFLGSLVEILAVEGKRQCSLEVEETAHLFVRSREGVMGRADLSWTISQEQPSYVRIYGSEGTVLVGWKDSRYRRACDREWIAFGEGYDKVQAFLAVLDGFAVAIRGGDTPLVGPEDALASVEVVEAAYASLRSRSWQAIPSRRRTDDGIDAEAPAAVPA